MKKLLLLLVSIMMLTIFTACGNSGSSDETAGKEKEEDKKLEEVSIMLDWYPNAVHSFLYVAQEKGYFEEEGIKVDIQFPANPTDPVNLAAAGKITMGISYQPDVLMARANEDVKVKSIAAIVRSPLNHAVFLKDSPIQTPKDLEGKKVGFPGTPVNEPLIKAMVKHDGGDPEKVEMVDVGFELGSSIVSKRVDAVVGAYINHEVPVLSHEGHETRNFDPTDYGVPNFYELIAVTSDNTWNKDQEKIKAFWRAASKGFKDTEENPDEALKILLANQDKENFPLIEEVEKESLSILLPKMKSDAGFGSQESEPWEKMSTWMKESNLLEKEPSLEETFVNIAE
ncbi:ABC transporter substrate-binding protein [Metabacillus fastidiosus]|uniref:ABC transporter substrate-binding protein n=1 Tax=Metabacillus fastidiosus TaxID=1458 RepID=UPI002E1BC9C8|nr:ABC transporter substrate-binding protein [Metabacillus fastidiosus]